MRRLHRNCLSHSSVAVSGTCGRYGAIHNPTKPVGVREMDGGYPLPRSCEGLGLREQPPAK